MHLAQGLNTLWMWCPKEQGFKFEKDIAIQSVLPILNLQYVLVKNNFFSRFNELWPIWLAPALLLSFLACFLHLLDRQAELTSRSDFLWQYKLSSEEEGVDTMRGINKILLENILPAHVAEHYLARVQGMSRILQDSNVITSF